MRYIVILGKEAFFKAKGYPIVFVPRKEFRKRMYGWFYKLFCRGYTDSKTVYIKKGTFIGLEKLILHEIGHILGHGHTWKPFIMHPSWIGRWFWRWNKDDYL